MYFGSKIQVESSQYFGSETTWVSENTGVQLGPVAENLYVLEGLLHIPLVMGS